MQPMIVAVSFKNGPETESIFTDKENLIEYVREVLEDPEMILCAIETTEF